MNPVEIWARNLRSWRALDLELPAGLTAISGPNGAGKSTILAIIELALYAGKGELARQMTRDPDGDTCEVAVVFDHAGRRYRVRRTFSQRAGKTLVAFDRDDDEGGWTPLTAETAAQTQQVIEQTLGLDRRTFRASSYIAQGDGAAFTLAQPRERKDILASILALDVWERLTAAAAADRKRWADRGQRVMGQLEALEAVCATGDQHRRELAAAEEAFRAFDEQRERLRGAVRAQRTHVEQTAEQARHVAALRAEVASAGALAQQAGEHHRKLQQQIMDASQLSPSVETRAAAERLPELEAERDAATAARSEWEQRDRERDAALAEQRHLKGLQASLDTARLRALRALGDATADLEKIDHAQACPTCGQTLPDEAREHARAQYDEALRQLADTAAEVEREDQLVTARLAALEIPPDPGNPPEPIPELDDLIAAARKAVSAMERHQERMKLAEQWSREAADAEQRALELTAAHAVAELALTDALAGFNEAADATAREALAEAEKALQRVEREWDAEQARRSTARAAVDAVERRERERDEATSDLYDAQQELAAAMLLERAYGRNGIPAMLMEQSAIPQIEAEANRVLQDLGTSFTTELRTQRALKSGETAEALDIVVHSPDGEALYEDLSGGERTRVDVAVRLGLARLLAHRKGAPVRFLAMDEPAHLDDEGMQRLAAVLATLDKSFDRILVVSHVPTLGEAFDQQIHVAKRGDESTLVDEREAVTA